MLLSKGGITIELEYPAEIKRFKAMGYVEAEVGYPNPKVTKDGVNEPEPAETAETERVSIEQIYALCDKSGVSPDDLILEGENPSLSEVKAAIKAAKKAGK